MGLFINTNIQSMTAQRSLFRNTFELGRSMERLSTGYRINRAGDDAAGLSISESLRSQIRGMEQARNNAQTGLNLMEIADGAYSSINDITQRIRELTVQAANDTNGATQRDAIEEEINNLLKQIDQIANSTKFNGVKMLSASAPANFYLQVGPNGGSENYIDVASAFGEALATALGFTSMNVNFASAGAARTFLTEVDNVLDEINTRRARIGAYSNRLSYVMDNVAIGIENYSASEARIREVDIANESANLVRNQILQQASVSILAQANQSSYLLLSLITGG